MPMFPTADYEFKVVMVGDHKAGKTCLATRFRFDKFVDEGSTVGANFSTRVVDVDNAVVRMQIWDTPGTQRFRAMMPLFYRQAKGVVVVYDSTDLHSFDHALFWLKHSLAHADGEVDVVLVGSKSDRREAREVPARLAGDMALARGLDFFETSAKDGTNVREAFEALARAIKRREESRGNSLEVMDAIELDHCFAEAVSCF